MAKIKKNNKSSLSKEAKEKRKINIIVYLSLRILVIASMILQGLNHNWNNVALCIVTLILFTVPNLLSKKFSIIFPETLEIIVYLFIFSAAILGETQNFYSIFTHWDTILHTLNGILCAALGLSLVDLLNTNNDNINLSPAFVALVAFSFSMTVGVMWEFGEYTVDTYLGKDMQKDKIVEKFQSVKINETGENVPIVVNNIGRTEVYDKTGAEIVGIDNGYLDIGLHDTMKDLIVNFIGALVFSIFGFLYLKNREGYRFLEILIPKRKREN